MNKTFPRLFAVAAVATLFSSCILLENPEGDDPGWRTTRERESAPSGSEFRRGLEFAPGGTLTVENDYGDVRITGWDREEAEIVATAAAVEAQPQRSARQYRVRNATPDVEVRETGRGVLVRTPTFEGPGRAPAVDYEIQVPNSVVLSGIRISEGNLTVADVFGRFEASVDQGDLSVTNYSGPLRATVGTGNADVEVLDLRDGDEITITTRRGDIFLRLESGAGAIIEADAPRGEVSSDFDLGVRLPAPTVKGWIGEGGPTVILRALDGRIRILRATGAGAPSAAAQAGK